MRYCGMTKYSRFEERRIPATKIVKEAPTGYEEMAGLRMNNTLAHTLFLLTPPVYDETQVPDDLVYKLCRNLRQIAHSSHPSEKSYAKALIAAVRGVFRANTRIQAEACLLRCGLFCAGHTSVDGLSVRLCPVVSVKKGKTLRDFGSDDQFEQVRTKQGDVVLYTEILLGDPLFSLPEGHGSFALHRLDNAYLFANAHQSDGERLWPAAKRALAMWPKALGPDRESRVCREIATSATITAGTWTQTLRCIEIKRLCQYILADYLTPDTARPLSKEEFMVLYGEREKETSLYHEIAGHWRDVMENMEYVNFLAHPPFNPIAETRAALADMASGVCPLSSLLDLLDPVSDPDDLRHQTAVRAVRLLMETEAIAPHTVAAWVLNMGTQDWPLLRHRAAELLEHHFPFPPLPHQYTNERSD